MIALPGFTDPSLYTGQVEFVDIPSGMEGYWILPMTSKSQGSYFTAFFNAEKNLDLQVNGQAVPLAGTAQSSYSAIDTGTTLIGGPPAVIEAIFADIPGSAPGSGDYEGYYTYPCDQSITLSITFGGGTAWNVDPADFMLTQLSTKQCVGALFSLDTSGGNGPAWIVGDTFLVRLVNLLPVLAEFNGAL